MIQLAQHYAEMAEASRAAAAEQLLANVRQKHLTAAARWEALAFGQRKMDALRLRRLLEHRQSATLKGKRDGE